MELLQVPLWRYYDFTRLPTAVIEEAFAVKQGRQKAREEREAIDKAKHK